MSTSWKKLKVGHKVWITNPQRGIKLIGTVARKPEYYGKGLFFDLEKGGQMFIPEHSIKEWEFMKMSK